MKSEQNKKVNILTIGDKQYKETDLSPEIITSIRHILILQNKNKELSTDFAINQNTITILENNLKILLKDVPTVQIETKSKETKSKETKSKETKESKEPKDS